MRNRVYFFATCLASAAMSKTVVNAIKLLQNAGVQVVYKKDQTCCGQPSYNTGYFEETKRIARFNAELFSEQIPVVIPSGSCGGMMSHDYLELFEGDADYERVANFAARVVELSQYLEQIGYEPVDLGEPEVITWHSNCHALRVQRSIDANKALLSKLKNVEIKWLQYEEECCGFGGTFAVKEPEISNAMAMAKVEDIIASGAKTIVSADGGCLLNIRGTLAKLGHNDIRAVHLYDYLAERVLGGAK